MAFTGNYMCTSFKQELLKGVHDFDTGKMFLRLLFTLTVPHLMTQRQLLSLVQVTTKLLHLVHIQRVDLPQQRQQTL
jgi:hypothetical protein